MAHRVKRPSQLEADAIPMDLILITLPAEIQDKKTVRGTDYAVGFFVGVQRLGARPFVALSSVQKSAHSQPKPERYPLDMIRAYEVLRRYAPDPRNPIDTRVMEALGLAEIYKIRK